MRQILILSLAAAMAAGAASAQTAQSSAPPAKTSLMSRMMSKVTKKTTPTSSTTTTTTSAKVSPKAVATTAGGKPRTAESIACSEKANTQNIHGDARKKFMRSCKKGG